MKHLHMLTVRGTANEWSIITDIDAQTATDWLEDGLDVVRLENSIPAWVVDIGLARPWMAVQSFFNR